LGSDRIFF